MTQHSFSDIFFIVDLVGCQFNDWKHAADASGKLENVAQSLFLDFLFCGREKKVTYTLQFPVPQHYPRIQSSCV
jgi:hypothetical protein